MSLKLNSAGGGSVTLQEPSTASNLTLDLPATAGTIALTSQVAGTNFGDIGSYLVAGTSVLGAGANTFYAAGTTFAGNTLQYNSDRGSGFTQSFGVAGAASLNTSVAISNYGLSGTWRVMHAIRGTDGTFAPIGLFVRIS
jgi:hypothetical protein